MCSVLIKYKFGHAFVLVRSVSHLTRLDSFVLVLGPPVEALYELLKCGIPISTFPVDSEGNCKTDYHNFWLQERVKLERCSKFVTTTSAAIASLVNPPATRPPIGAITTNAAAPVRTTNINSQSNKMPSSLGGVTGLLPTTNSALLAFAQNASLFNLGVRNNNSTVPTAATVPTTADPKPKPRTSPLKTSSVSATTTTSSAAAAAATAQMTIEEPKPTDCLLGRGRPIDQHVGNVRFREYLQQGPLLMEYQRAAKEQKKWMSDYIRKTLQERYGVRFLKQLDDRSGLWVQAEDRQAREKIARTLRRLLQYKEERISK